MAVAQVGGLVILPQDLIGEVVMAQLFLVILLYLQMLELPVLLMYMLPTGVLSISSILLVQCFSPIQNLFQKLIFLQM